MNWRLRYEPRFATGSHERTGELLREAKQLLQHGEWMLWRSMCPESRFKQLTSMFEEKFAVVNKCALSNRRVQFQSFVDCVPTYKL